MEMKKLVSLLTAFVMLVVIVLPTMSVNADAIVFESDVDVYSEAVYMISLDNGSVVYSKNSDVQRVPASLTKIMTCLIVLETYNGDKEALMAKRASGGSAAFNELDGTGCSNADIRRGEELSYYDLLCALMIQSACEAANILAIDMCGSIDAFVEKMNEKAAELGMKNTHYSNAHGLFAKNNYTTCEDIAILCKYILSKYDLFMEICSQPSYDLPATPDHPEGTHLVSTNKLLIEGSDYYYRFARGIKTGFLDEAGRCLVSTATRNGYTYLTITMGAPGYDESGVSTMYNCIDHKTLYTWAFDTLEYTTLLDNATEMGEVAVEYGKNTNHVTVRPAASYSQLWPNNVDISQVKKKITLDQSAVAPVVAGQKLGTVELTYAGQTISTIDLVATSSVERDEIKSDVKVSTTFKDSSHFKLAIIAAVGAVLLYVLIFAAVMFARKKRRRARYENNSKYDDDDYDDEPYDNGDYEDDYDDDDYDG